MRSTFFLLFLLFPVCAFAMPPRAVVLSDGGISAKETAIAHAAVSALMKAGYTVQEADVSRAAALLRGQCALFVLPQAERLPVPLFSALHSYLSRGGALLAMGGPVGSKPLQRGVNGNWETLLQLQQAQALLPPAHIDASFEGGASLQGWQRSSNQVQTSTVYTLVSAHAAGRSASALHVQISSLDGWDTYISPPLQNPFAGGRTLTVFSARGGKNTHSLAVEWDEKDGSRWIATVVLTTHWRRIVLSPSEFHYWDGPPGRSSTSFEPGNAVRFSVGEAFGFTGSRPGRYSYEVAAFGASTPSEAGEVGMAPSLPSLDLITPVWKFFTMHGPLKFMQQGRRLVAAGSENSLLSPQPRPGGSGFDRNRVQRTIPLVTAYDAGSGQWRGTPAVLMLHTPGQPYSGTRGWIAFDSQQFYASPQGQALVTRMARMIRRGLFLLEGGANYFTVFEKQNVVLGAKAINLADSVQNCSVRIQVRRGSTVWQKTWHLQLAPNAVGEVKQQWTPPARWPRHGYHVITQLRGEKGENDILQQGLHVWLPPGKENYIAIRNGHFWHNGKIWRVNGVNYMPSSGIGLNHDTIFEHWLSAASYDPNIVQRDLNHIKNLGMNAVSIFVYADDVRAQNLLDILRRCRSMGLYANVSLRPSLNTFLNLDYHAADNAAWIGMKRIVNTLHLAENDTVFAYEIAWEPSFGNAAARTAIDPVWRRWTMHKYGSLINAARAWGIPPPLNGAGELTTPTDAQLNSQGGRGVKLCADYRHFLDYWLKQCYGSLTKRLKAIAPHQLVSFRMTSAGYPGDAGAASLPYQLEGNAMAEDFLSPECYGRVGIAYLEHTIPFEIAYGRSVAPREPFLWAETGMTVWDAGEEADDPGALKQQAHYYSTLYRYTIEAGGDGLFFWWYPGGLRVNEGSDFGLINPDGTDRPCTRVVLILGQKLLHASLPPKPGIVFIFHRDNHPDGIVGIYRKLADAFWQAWSKGMHPALKAESGFSSQALPSHTAGTAK